MAFISVENVTKIYKLGENKVYALNGMSFSIEKPGKFVVVHGPSGAGKSTLLNILGGMDYIDDGNVFIDGELISSYKRKKLTRYRGKKIGFVFQFYNLIPSLNAYDNVALSRNFGKNPLSAAEVLKSVGLEKRMRHYPNELSGGELQRVSIARALCKNPEIILCDEPTGALDSETGKSIFQMLQNMSRDYNKTVVIVTHNPAIIPAADILISIKNGKMISCDINDNPKSVSEVEI